MPRDDLALYLTLTPEFGGTRFGPFEGLEVRLGTDRDRCHIALAEGLGVVRDHAKVLRQGPQSLILTPAERTAAVWLWKAGAARPTQVQAPTAVRPGDAFSLVTPQGPRFVIELAPLPEAIRAARSTTGKRSFRGLTPGKLIAEIWRLFIARLYTFSPISMGARVWYFITSGAIWQPRILITLFLTGMAMVTATFASCRIMSLTNEVAALTDKNTQLEQGKIAAEGLSGKKIENLKLTEIVTTMTGKVDLQRALDADGTLQGKVKERAKSMLGDRTSYEWVSSGSGAVNALSSWRASILESDDAKAGIDPTTASLLFYAGVVPYRLESEWARRVDVLDENACVRGPAMLTYRQGLNLGLENVQPDAFVLGDASVYVNQPEQRLGLVVTAATKAGGPIPTADAQVDAHALASGQATCFFQAGDDDRTDMGRVRRMMITQFGLSAKGMPDTQAAVAPVARLARLYAADIPHMSFIDPSKSLIDLRQKSVTSVLQAQSGGGAVLDAVAEVIARRIVLPCDARLNGDAKAMEAVLGPLPDPLPCLLLFYRLEHDG